MPWSHLGGPQSVAACRPALPLLFSPTLGVGYDLFWSGVPSLENRQPYLHLLCMKRKGSQGLALGRPIPLEKFLRNKRPVAVRKKSFAKNFNLGSQFKGSLSLDFLFLLSGPFTDSNCSSHKLGDGPRLVVLTYIKLEVTGYLSLLSRGFPKWSGTSPQPDSRCTKRKLYFQCFTFDFFSMAIMKPDLLLKQCHPRSPVSLGALWTVCTRLNARAEQVRSRSSQVAMKDQRLCHDVGTTCTDASSYLFRISLITGSRGNRRP
ncbi:hypothetical protein Cgig2_027195 [Carnegiea gigantea]|uniref:Uncharacterized protein n=1 Tax=Carnegiea gigantea TaxID=171969 RepID=A0A9Q1KUM0_9CARY|nr:hypothetical protein Cgig2_027195 [Carnegiea gigantea]